MNKQDLIKKIDSTWLSAKRKTELKEAVNNFEDALLRQPLISGRSEQLADHKCKFYVNADWTKLKCECGKEQQPEVGCFSSLEECENEAILFTKDKLKVVSELLSEDYKTGYKEGVEHYLASKNNL